MSNCQAGKCANCGTCLSCGCQKRVTADGKKGCTKCIHTLLKNNGVKKSIIDSLFSK